eukprot:maker-scaffold411_size179879-snap-gene-0.30 protein:Tk06322 transcript:maker-scaffold411_size179879-snap-gene-0.30-mRNA-1 annotation:"otu domain-containing protein 6b"
MRNQVVVECEGIGHETRPSTQTTYQCVMSDEPLTLEFLQAKHRQEKKDLQSRIQSLKKSVPKGDKKKRKEVQEEVSNLEDNLVVNHTREILEIEGRLSSLVLLSSKHSPVLKETKPSLEQGLRPSRANKRRENKVKKEKERLEEIKIQENLNIHGVRHTEDTKIKEILAAKKLTLYDVASDGDCLFAAVGHQLVLHKSEHWSNEDLRRGVSKVLRQHKSDYLPFLDMDLSGQYEEEYEEYCRKVESTKVWGGDLELQALSQLLGVPIEIIHAEGRVFKFGEQFLPARPFFLTYHRHMYSLGAHYNSTCPLLTE